MKYRAEITLAVEYVVDTHNAVQYFGDEGADWTDEQTALNMVEFDADRLEYFDLLAIAEDIDVVGVKVERVDCG